MGELFLGIDLGGTNVKAGVVDTNGAIVGQASVSTGGGAETVIQNMVAAATQSLKTAGIGLEQVVAVGITSPGALVTAKGLVIKASNIEGFVNLPLRARISAALQRPAVLENDANAAAYGEYWAGAGREGRLGPGVRDMVMVTLGTGVGSGVVIDGQVLHGRHDFAGEIGHAILVYDGIPCTCGQRGCVERYCSASTMASRAMERLSASSQASTLRPVLKAKGTLTARDVAEHAQAGDALAREHWQETCRYLAIACLNIIRVVDPEMIVLGGGMAGAGEFLRAAVEMHLRALYWNMTPLKATVALAQLGNDAGLVGAAGVAKDAFDRGKLPGVGE